MEKKEGEGGKRENDKEEEINLFLSLMQKGLSHRKHTYPTHANKMC